VIFSQAAHQVDIVRLLMATAVRSVRSGSGNWDRERPTEGAYSALLTFDDGAFASLTYSGYGHFDADELVGWVNEIGVEKDPAQYGAARRALANAPTAQAELDAKNARNYGGTRPVALPHAPWHEHFGFIVASCEHGDVRPLPNGVMVYGDHTREMLALEKPRVPRGEVIDELYDAIVHGRAPLHDGRWGAATLEVCLAILRSAREQREVVLNAPQ
jgi:phthalate 4,5-cis-dihydrodiol dehydrogenase